MTFATTNAAVFVRGARAQARSSLAFSCGGRSSLEHRLRLPGISGAFVLALTHSCRSFHDSSTGPPAPAPAPATATAPDLDHHHHPSLHPHPHPHLHLHHHHHHHHPQPGPPPLSPQLSLSLPLPLARTPLPLLPRSNAAAALASCSSRQKSHSCADPDKTSSLPSSSSTNTFSKRTRASVGSRTDTHSPSGLIASSATFPYRRFHSTSTLPTPVMAEPKWPGAVVRKTFLEFFEKRAHTIGMLSPTSPFPPATRRDRGICLFYPPSRHCASHFCFKSIDWLTISALSQCRLPPSSLTMTPPCSSPMRA